MPWRYKIFHSSCWFMFSSGAYLSLSSSPLLTNFFKVAHFEQKESDIRYVFSY